MRKLLAVTGACVLLMGCGASPDDGRGGTTLSRTSIDDDAASGRDTGDGDAARLAAREPISDAQHVPGDDVATVDGDPITRADYDRWFEINARQSASKTGGEPVIPDPPSYAGCIAALKERAVRVRGRAPSETQLRARCRTRGSRLREQTMALLIQSVWIEKEAEALGIEASDATVERALRKTRRQSFPTEEDYQRFLRDSGMTEDDVLFRLRIQELSTAITRHVQRGAAKDKTKRLNAFAREFQGRWTEQTKCRSGFVIAICSNFARRKPPSAADREGVAAEPGRV